MLLAATVVALQPCRTTAASFGGMDHNPEPRVNADPTAITRLTQAEQQLASAGIKLGGYRLDHPLSGIPVRAPQRVA